MRDILAARLLKKVMNWGDDEEVAKQLPVLQAMSSFKYDNYRRFQPGGRFIERFALWLEQFDDDERQSAFDFVRQRLMFVSETEMRHLVHTLFPDFVRPLIRDHAAADAGVEDFRIGAIERGTEFRALLRQSLFLGLSDGARLDEFRRSNRLSNEQVYVTYQVAADRLDDMREELGKDLEKIDASIAPRFRRIFLVDDFAGSGTSILRFVDGVPDGRLKRFADIMANNRDLFADDAKIYICLYVATTQALEYLKRSIDAYGAAPWQDSPSLIPVMTLDQGARFTCATDVEFDKLLHSRYRDEELVNEHRLIGGKSMVHGYAECGLSLVFEPNCPNNSVYLLWEDRTGLYVPLFPRVDRHLERKL
jgi:hypothetical protein